MATTHSKAVRDAALAQYMKEHPGASAATAQKAVATILAEMSRSAAETKYLLVAAAQANVDAAAGDIVLPNASELPILNVLLDDDDAEDGDEPSEEDSEFLAAVEAAGIPATAPDELITAEQFSDLLKRYGADLESAAIQTVVGLAPSMTYERADGLAQALALQHPSQETTAYSVRLTESGFDTAPVELGLTTPSEVRGGLPPSQAPEVPTTGGKGWTRQPETGWLAYGGGVLANPDTGEVVFDPNSTAPGSSLWRKRIQESWSEEKVAAERKRLAEFGYLSSDEAKLKGFDVTFLNALAAYHASRYVNYGKSVADDLGLAAAGKPPLVNFEDFSAQTRNDVREQYR